MNNFSDIIYLDPRAIIINRSSRQRTEIDTSDILESIKIHGIINPIIIEAQEAPIGVNGETCDIFKLVAGERRLEACKQLNIQVPCRLVSSLSTLEAQILEFEENHKRKNLPWRDEVKGIGNLYDAAQTQIPPITKSQLSSYLSIPESRLNQLLHVYKFLDEKILLYAKNLSQAIDLLHRFKSIKSDKIETTIRETISHKPLPKYLMPLPPSPPKLSLIFDADDTTPETPPPILNESFLSWILTYSGPKFNLIHCDFPQEKSDFWLTFSSFIDNSNNLLAPNAHVLIWFKMERYDFVTSRCKPLGTIIPQPFIWYRSDTKSNESFGTPPRNTYEPCLIISRNKPFLRQIQNAYHSPHTSQPICPNQKPITMLKYLLSTFVDSETTFLDPTCGSGSALIACEELKPKSLLGLELDPLRCGKANENLLRAREIRKLIDK